MRLSRTSVVCYFNEDNTIAQRVDVGLGIDSDEDERQTTVFITTYDTEERTHTTILDPDEALSLSAAIADCAIQAEDTRKQADIIHRQAQARQNTIKRRKAQQTH